jgi:hypothetical protein
MSSRPALATCVLDASCMPTVRVPVRRYDASAPTSAWLTWASPTLSAHKVAVAYLTALNTLKVTESPEHWPPVPTSHYKRPLPPQSRTYHLSVSVSQVHRPIRLPSSPTSLSTAISVAIFSPLSPSLLSPAPTPPPLS